MKICYMKSFKCIETHAVMNLINTIDSSVRAL